MPEPARRVLAAAVTVALAAVVAWGIAVGEPGSENRVEALGARIKCPVCQGESIVDSPAGFARDMVAFVGEKVDEGWTDEEILTYLEDRFPGTRLDPGFSGASLALWVLPAAFAAGGIALLVNRIQRPTSELGPAAGDAPKPGLGDLT